MFIRIQMTNPRIVNGSRMRLTRPRMGPIRARSQSFLTPVLLSGLRDIKVDTVIFEVTMKGKVKMQLSKSKNLPIENSILGEYLNDDLLSIIWNMIQRGSESSITSIDLCTVLTTQAHNSLIINIQVKFTITFLSQFSNMQFYVDTKVRKSPSRSTVHSLSMLMLNESELY